MPNKQKSIEVSSRQTHFKNFYFRSMENDTSPFFTTHDFTDTNIQKRNRTRNFPVFLGNDNARLQLLLYSSSRRDFENFKQNWGVEES